MRDETGGLQELTIEADTESEASEQAADMCRDWGRGGEWGDGGASITVWWHLIEEDGEEVAGGQEVVDIEPDHDALILRRVIQAMALGLANERAPRDVPVYQLRADGSHEDLGHALASYKWGGLNEVIGGSDADCSDYVIVKGICRLQGSKVLQVNGEYPCEVQFALRDGAYAFHYFGLEQQALNAVDCGWSNGVAVLKRRPEPTDAEVEAFMQSLGGE